MDKKAIIQQHKNNKTIQTAFTGEEILHDFIGNDNITYWVIRKNGKFDIVPAATLSAPPLQPFVPGVIPTDPKTPTLESRLLAVETRLKKLEAKTP